jgi:predicted kinase
VYDDTRAEVILMSGLPGAGKDMWIERNVPGRPVIALDAIRRELGVDPRDDQGAVTSVARARARELLRAGTPFIWNATNISRTVREVLIRLFALYRARVVIVSVEAPWAVLLRRNQRRAHPVPLRVLDSLGAKFEMPSPDEAHEVVCFDSSTPAGS